MKLYEIAHARAGDKGDVCNIVVVSRSPEQYATLVERLTAARVKAHFEGLSTGPIVRYELPGLYALNFVIRAALHGGVTRSTALDAHGKSLAFALLELVL